MAFINAPSGTFNTVQGNQTNITNQYIAKTFDWPGESIASGAFYDSASSSSSPCFPGTREEITALISDWISDPNDRLLCWLCGHAGSGKSAIAQTIARRCADAGQLAAAFFCSRGNADHGRKLISTIAFQLTRSLPSLEDPIHAVVEGDPQIFNRAIPVQFQRLIINPLIHNRSTLRRLVVVIDALDECDEKAAAEIARLISDAAENRDLPIQFFITSRPALHIEVPFITKDFVIKSFILHGFGVRDDIRLFLTSRFQEIYEHHPAMRDVASPWPSDTQIDRLIEMSDLFIFASSVIRFVDDRSNSPDDQLEAVLGNEQWSLPEDDELDKLYHQILSPPRVKGGDKEHLRLILGTIITLQKPLPLPAIGILLRAHMSTGRLRALLDPLRSLIYIPEKREEQQGKPVTTFHQSFPDFLTDRSRSARDYWIDSSTFAANLTTSCLDLLSGSESMKLQDRESNSIVLDYAHTHYLGLLKEGVANNVFIEIAGLITLHVIMLVVLIPYSASYFYLLVTDHGWLWRFRLVMVAYTLPILCTIFLIVEFICPIKSTHIHYSLHTFASFFIVLMWAVSGNFGCQPILPPTCREIYNYFTCGPGSPHIILRPVASGTIVDLIIRTVFGLDSEMACEVSGYSLGASVMRAVTFGAIFDLVFQIITVVAAQILGLQHAPLTVVAVWMMGSAVGRAMGVAIAVISDTISAFWIIVVIITALTTVPGMLLVWSEDDPIRDTDHYFKIFLHQRHCRWIKACYHLAIQQRQITISPSTPLQYAILFVKFYVMILKPTHVSALTPQERLYCDWCREMDVEDGNRLQKWILRTIKGL